MRCTVTPFYVLCGDHAHDQLIFPPRRGARCAAKNELRKSLILLASSSNHFRGRRMPDPTYILNGGFKPTMKRFADLDGPDFFPTPRWATFALIENESF